MKQSSICKGDLFNISVIEIKLLYLSFFSLFKVLAKILIACLYIQIRETLKNLNI